MITQRQIQLEQEYYETFSKKIRNGLHRSEGGQLYTKLQRGHRRFYMRRNGREQYLSRKQFPLIRNKIRQEIAEAYLEQINQNLVLLNQFGTQYGFYSEDHFQKKLEHIKAKYEIALQEMMKENECGEIEELFDLWADAAKHTSRRQLQRWANGSYSQLQYHSEDRRHVTPGGQLVRSKSELNIATMLEMKGIPYHYDEALELQTGTVYPDFLFLRASDCCRLIWEHFGMMNNPDYRARSVEKIAEYAENGYYCGYNFIATYDTEDGGLDLTVVERNINLMILA